MPLRPARPVRPERCWRVSASLGSSTWTTRLRLGRSMPRAATSVATSTRARPSRSACSAWLRSFWLCSPDKATALKPRSTSGVQPPHILAGRAEQQRALRLVEPEQVDHAHARCRPARPSSPGRRCRHGPAPRRPSRSAARPSGSAWPGRRSARASSPRRAGSAARPGSRRVSPRDPRESPCRASRPPRRGRDAKLRQVESAPFEMVAKPARSADDDMGAVLERAPLLRRRPCRRRRSRSGRPPGRRARRARG